MTTTETAFKITIDSSTVYDEPTRTLHITRHNIFGPDHMPSMDGGWIKQPIDVESDETNVILRFKQFATWLDHCISYRADYMGESIVLNVWKDTSTLVSNYTYKNI